MTPRGGAAQILETFIALCLSFHKIIVKLELLNRVPALALICSKVDPFDFVINLELYG